MAFRRHVRVEINSDRRKESGSGREGKGSTYRAVVTTDPKPRLVLASCEDARDKTRSTGGLKSIPRPWSEKTRGHRGQEWENLLKRLLEKAAVRARKAAGMLPNAAVSRVVAEEAEFTWELSFEAVIGLGSAERQVREERRPSRRWRNHNGQSGLKGLFLTWLVQGAEIEVGELGRKSV